MKKVTLISFLIVVIILSGYIFISSKNDKERTPSNIATKTGTIKFNGTITNVHNGCWADGICSIEVDKKWNIAIIQGGLLPPNSKPEIKGDVVGIEFNEENSSIGKNIEVYANKIDENQLSIFGSNEYYVRVIKK